MPYPPLFVIPEDQAPDRADRILARCLPEAPSRSSLARLIREGLVLVADQPVRPSTILSPGDEVTFLPQTRADREPEPRSVPSIAILYEDDDVVVVDKPAGLVVHPGAGRQGGTLVDVLIRTRPQMIGVGESGRWGIVHRLDRDTSGVMVAAKNVAAHSSLSTQFKEHTAHRRYVALVRGRPSKESGVIDAPLGRHTKDRKRISTHTAKPRHAVTRWKVARRLGQFTLLDIFPETGRTHQIRVHLAAAGLPVVGDPVYGRSRGKGERASQPIQTISRVLHRQALHAAMLGFLHPAARCYMEFQSPLPADMNEAIRIAMGEMES